MFGITSLWVFLAMVAVMAVGYYRFSSKAKKPFEIISGITGFFDAIHTKIEETIAYIKTLSKSLADLHERISKVLESFGLAQSEREAVEQRLKQHLTDLVDQRIAEIKEGLDKQTERIFHGLDMHRKVLLTEVTSALTPPEPAVQQAGTEPSKDATEVRPFTAASELAEPPKVDPSQGGGVGFAPDPFAKTDESVKTPAAAKGRARKK